MSWGSVKLGKVLKQYRIEHLVKDDIEYKQVTISKHDGVTFRGVKLGKNIGRKRQFVIDLKQYPNTLLFVRQGVEDGSIGIATSDVDGCIVTENMPMFSIENIEVDFLRLIIKSALFKNKVSKIQTTGSAQKSIHERQLLEIEIPYPDKTDQNRVVKSFSGIELRNSEISSQLAHQIALIKQLRQSFLREAMQGKLVEQDPAEGSGTELLKLIQNEKNNLISDKKIKQGKIQEAELQNEIMFQIPSNWVWCKLDEICWNITDGTHQTPNYTNNGRIFLSAQNIKPFLFMPKDHKFVSEDDHTEYVRNRKAQKGDLLVARVGAGIGETAVIDREIEFSFYVSLGLVQPFQKYIHSGYLAYVFNSPYGVQYAKGNISSKGGSAGNFNLGRIRSFLVPLPPLSEQHRIVAKLEELMGICDSLETSVKESKEQNDRLLQEVLREALEQR